MKIVILILSFLTLTELAFGQELFSVKDGTRSASIKILKSVYNLKSFDYSDQIPKNACTDKVIQNFLTRTGVELKKAIPFKDKKALLVRVKNKRKSISPQSLFGKKLSNFSTTIVILKKEVGLSCK